MAIRLPQKPRPGYHSISELTRALNGLIDYVSSFSITGKKPVRVTRDMFKAEISLEEEDETYSVASGSYNGWFKVFIDEDDDTVRISDGGDPDSAFAGYAYYNAAAVHCRRTSMSPENGYLCLKISYDSTYNVDYVFRDDVPDMPKLEDAGGDNTAEYPLAYLSEGDDGWVVQQLCYGIPQLWCFGPCDTEESEE